MSVFGGFSVNDRRKHIKNDAFSYALRVSVVGATVTTIHTATELPLDSFEMTN